MDIYVGPCDLGSGVFAARGFEAGETILRLEGAVISLADALAKGDTAANVVQIGETDYIDVVAPAVFLNHACEPNAGIADDLVLIALRTIQTGEEIRFDYSTTMLEEMWTMKCYCGSPNCRGVIRDFTELPRDTQDEYLRLGVVQSFIRRRLSL